MRRSLGEGWFIQLPEEWRKSRTDCVAVVWRAPGKSIRAFPGDTYRCATTLDILADIERDLPPNPTGKISEGGSHGIGVRAAWLYRDPGEGIRHTLRGFSFTAPDSTRYLVTEFHSKDTDDADWAFSVWRSMTYEP